MAQYVLMVQGTTSDAGKSLMVAGLCRLLARNGVNVAPFKPQNMALNSAVTADGGEIGRAQALQAIAAKQAPTTDMNPILLKPESDKRAQIIVHGKALNAMDAVSYHEFKKEALAYVLESFERLSEQHDVIVVEGAGSPAEINLRENDVANMGFAEAVDCPVLLIADIDRGGVFATVVGTLDLLAATERERIIGVVINKFRGDIALLHSGLDWLEERISKPVLGVLPFIQNLYLDAEDALTAEQALDEAGPQLRISVIVFPRISNHTDFDSLRLNPAIDLRYVRLDEKSDITACDLLILPGTKNVREDLQQLFATSLHESISRHLRYGGKLLGICGGLQMLGQQIHDPQGIESDPGSSAGLGLLEFETTLEAHKQLQNRSGELQLECAAAAPVSGYEIHCGLSEGPALGRPLIRFSNGHRDGVISADNQIIGTYLHGLFDDATANTAILKWAGLHKVASIDIAQQRELQLERLADVVEEAVDVATLFPKYFEQQSEKFSWNA